MSKDVAHGKGKGLDCDHCVVLVDIVRRDSEGLEDQGGSATVLSPRFSYSNRPSRSQALNLDAVLCHETDTIPWSITWELWIESRWGGL